MLNYFLLIFSVIIFVCILLNRFSRRFGVPVLLAFLLLGVVTGLGNDIHEESWLVSDVCTAALIFIMFYGGFGTSWKSARPVAVESGVLATLGVFLTAALTGLFCFFVLKWQLAESLLMGAVVSSTDAASVFSILRSRKLGLKNHTAPILEMESGSNDPMSYMLTAVMISVVTGTASVGQVGWMVFAQLVFGAGSGLVIATGVIWLRRHVSFANSGFDMLFISAVAVISYALPSLVGGNGYLSAYIVGIVLGNFDKTTQKYIVHFFDGVTTLMQIVIFFLLGYLTDLSSLEDSVLPALAIMAFMLIVARPVSVFSILFPFNRRKKPEEQYRMKQQLFISFVGLRGAASIVFAIMAVLGTQGLLQHDIFSVVFCLVILSISLQGSFIPWMARKLDTVDTSDVMKTFTDFSDEEEMQFGQLKIGADNVWCGKAVRDLSLPQQMLLTLVLRGEEKIVPTGSTQLQAGDVVIICTLGYRDEQATCLREHPLADHSRWAGKPLKDYPHSDASLVVMIKRGDERLVPNGDTVIRQGDVLVILDRD